jgi:hypothetical protein
VYQGLLQRINTASETLLYKSGALRSVGWVFIIGVTAWRLLGGNVTLDKTFYNLPCISPGYFKVSFLIAFLEE